jgi:hypothetical protein
VSTTHEITVKNSALLGRWVWECTCEEHSEISFATAEEAQSDAEVRHIDPIVHPEGREPIAAGAGVRVTEGKFAGVIAKSCGYGGGPMMCINAPHVEGGPHLHVQRRHVEVL